MPFTLLSKTFNMPKILKYLFIFLILSPLTASAKLSNNSTVCIDCRKESVNECKIDETGYNCMPLPDLRQVFSPQLDQELLDALKNDLNPPSTSNLDVCIPKDLDIIEEDIYACCVWSPEMGCQILQSKYFDGKNPCITCRGFPNMEGVAPKSCPCIKPENTGTSLVTLNFLSWWMILCVWCSL
ncbi:uncharacterized protein LOC108150151 isoform X1 [Drosophila elegans]|uniref:uncharacterized protein LOC108150151 isoform X1 n=1 Tax=Drosophila elegans TaxID=30023 RepID=UPI0007E5FB3A|nr:uncharacterized protein LOC108150151 isoform X1 [Drosophila elegans]